VQYFVLLPPLAESAHSVADLASSIQSLTHDFTYVDVGSIGEELDERAWIAALCLSISKQTYERDTLHFIALDASINRLADIAFAQRSAHRVVQSYVFIDCLPEVFLPEWPDAPVTLIITNPLSTLSQNAKLRGWDVKVVDDVLKLPLVLADTLQNYAL
jgi:hypothetical protein